MKKLYALKKWLPMAVIVCAMVATAACGNTKKYGCPNHLKANFSSIN